MQQHSVDNQSRSGACVVVMSELCFPQAQVVPASLKARLVNGFMFQLAGEILCSEEAELSEALQQMPVLPGNCK